MVTARISDRGPPFSGGGARDRAGSERVREMLPAARRPRAARWRSARPVRRGDRRGSRTTIDMKGSSGPWTVHIDADVLDLDGGTRTLRSPPPSSPSPTRAEPVRRGLASESFAKASRRRAGIVAGEGRPRPRLRSRTPRRRCDSRRRSRLGSGGLVEGPGHGARGNLSRAGSGRCSTLPTPGSINSCRGSARPSDRLAARASGVDL